MKKIFITAASQVTSADILNARLGMRFGRLDLASQLAILAVESVHIDFESQPRDRTGILLGSKAGSLAADLEFWNGRNATGGPSPTLFTYTLPSSAIGEIAIRHRITGPNLCLVGNDSILTEAADWLRRGEAEACLCVSLDIITPALGELMQTAPVAKACAIFLRRDDGLRELGENNLDIEAVCAAISQKISSI